MDSILVLNWLTTDKDISPDVFPLISDCRSHMARNWTVQVHHIFREANGYADALAKRDHQQQDLLIIYDTCPSFVYIPYIYMGYGKYRDL